mmetsp:Transcript_95/g.749  ORF Transcript_95/g.749 Transcript_95/m.749 type:complete len:202 (-) Transcript_95:235-840(-)
MWHASVLQTSCTDWCKQRGRKRTLHALPPLLTGALRRIFVVFELLLEGEFCGWVVSQVSGYSIPSLSKCLSFVPRSILLSRAVVFPARVFALVSDRTFASSQGNGVRTFPRCIRTNDSNVIYSLLNPITFSFHCSIDFVVACAVMMLLAGGLLAYSLRPLWVDQPTTKRRPLGRSPNWLKMSRSTEERRFLLAKRHRSGPW